MILANQPSCIQYTSTYIVSMKNKSVIMTFSYVNNYMAVSLHYSKLRHIVCFRLVEIAISTSLCFRLVEIAISTSLCFRLVEIAISTSLKPTIYWMSSIVRVLVTYIRYPNVHIYTFNNAYLYSITVYIGIQMKLKELTKIYKA